MHTRQRPLPRAVFGAGVALLALPFLTPCGSISVPLKLAGKVGDVASGGLVGRQPPVNSNAIADTPPLRVVSHAGVHRTLLISDTEAAGGNRKRARSPLAAVGAGLADTVIGAATLVDPALGGYPGLEGMEIEPFGRPSMQRGSQVLLDSPRVEVHGYEILVWKGKSSPHGIAQARAMRSAKLHVQEDHGHEYFALAERIHYLATSRTIVLEGRTTLKCGMQRIELPATPLARLDTATRTLYVSGAAAIHETPHHEGP